ncbi:MAG: crossover junction endodeoxyribonuclease RuvC [Verrucomicrobiota bacterium]
MAKRSARQLWKAKLEGKSVGSQSYALPGKSKFTGTILGIDPSLRGTGLAVVEFRTPHAPTILHSRTVKAKASLSMPTCLGLINTSVTELLEKYQVGVVALEQTIYVQNFQTAQILGAARGAAIAAAAVKELSVFEYPPLRVKQAVVGHGRASKEQVAKTVRALAKLGDELAYDESDAAAVAICHAFTGEA